MYASIMNRSSIFQVGLPTRFNKMLVLKLHDKYHASTAVAKIERIKSFGRDQICPINLGFEFIFYTLFLTIGQFC